LSCCCVNSTAAAIHVYHIFNILMNLRKVVFVSCTLLFASFVVQAEELKRLGDCTLTTVTIITQRLSDSQTGEVIPESGSTIFLSNGVILTGYNTVPGIEHSRLGDPVYLCLVGIPEDCPPGDDRGKVYQATNLSTNETWTLPDSPHSCGGA
jgi:hypothetical protein